MLYHHRLTINLPSSIANFISETFSSCSSITERLSFNGTLPVNFSFKSDKSCLPDKDFIADTYAHLLYENGKKKEAVKIETKALEMAAKAGNTEALENYKKTIEKFKGRK